MLVSFYLSGSTILIWLMAEIYVLLSPVMLINPQESITAGTKYVLVQMPATLLIIQCLLTDYSTHWVLLSSVAVKLGLVPVHSWVLHVIRRIRWKMLFLLRTLFKIPTLCLAPASMALMFVRRLRVVMGAIGGAIMTNLKKILAYSRIMNTGWVCVLLECPHWVRYLLVYGIALLVLTWYLERTNTSMSNLSLRGSPENRGIWMLYSLSLAGIPPFLGFGA